MTTTNPAQAKLTSKHQNQETVFNMQNQHPYVIPRTKKKKFQKTFPKVMFRQCVMFVQVQRQGWKERHQGQKELSLSMNYWI